MVNLRWEVPGDIILSMLEQWLLDESAGLEMAYAYKGTHVRLRAGVEEPIFSLSTQTIELAGAASGTLPGTSVCVRPLSTLGAVGEGIAAVFLAKETALALRSTQPSLTWETCVAVATHANIMPSSSPSTVPLLEA